VNCDSVEDAFRIGVDEKDTVVVVVETEMVELEEGGTSPLLAVEDVISE
jgi:hypothetical protein